MTTLPPAGSADTPSPKGFNARFDRTLTRVLVKLRLDDVPHIKRIIVTVAGGTVVLTGLVMVALPGPGLLVILAGLALLGTEYAWARLWLRRGRTMARKALTRTQRIFGRGLPPQSRRDDRK